MHETCFVMVKSGAAVQPHADIRFEVQYDHHRNCCSLYFNCVIVIIIAVLSLSESVLSSIGQCPIISSRSVSRSEERSGGEEGCGTCRGGGGACERKTKKVKEQRKTGES